MSRYIGNYVRVPSSEPQQASAPGIWSLSDQLAYQRANLWPPARDPYYNQTVLHLSGDVAGTRETNPVTQPRTFLSDASSNNFLLTPNGDVSARPFSPYLENYSVLLNGSTSYIASGANNLSMQFGTGPYTVELWVYQTTLKNDAFAVGGSGTIFQLGFYSTGLIQASFAGVAGFGSATVSVPINQWVHIAVVRNSTASNGGSYYINGQFAGYFTDSNNHSSSISTINIGTTNAGSSTYTFPGYISNLRIAKSAIYTSNFTPSTQPLTTTSQGATNVTMLTCQSNRFIDNSSSPNILTATNSPAISANSPFVSLDTTSGSGYFDGTTDYLTASASNIVDFAAGQAFTFECWVYVSSIATSQAITASGANTLSLAISGGQILYGKSGVIDLLVGTMAPANQWVHVAVGRNSSNTSRLWVNGTSIATSGSDTYSYNVATMYIGSNSSPASYVNGYISNLRVIKGTDVYGVGNANITVPTAPLQAVSGTSLLTLQTRAPANNQGILDSSPNSFVVTRNGNVAQGSFSPFSASGWSNLFNGSNGFTVPSGNANFSFAGEFTWEAFVNFNALPASGGAFGIAVARGSVASNSGFQFLLNNVSGSYVVTATISIGSTDYGPNWNVPAPSLGVWYHVAIVRDSANNMRCYWDGTLRSLSSGPSSVSGTLNTPAGVVSVGYRGNGYNDLYYNGYISNLRMIATAMYLGSNIQIPTAPFSPTVPNTRFLTCQSNRFLETGSNMAITPVSSPSVQPLSPFAPTQAYVASQLGGSLRVSASGDIISWSQNTWNNRFSSNNWSIEAWVYPTASTSTDFFVDQWTNGTTTTSLIFTFMGGNFDIYIGSTLYTLTGITPTLNAWTHIVAVRTSGTFSVFQNGVRTHTRSDLGAGVVNNGGTANRASPGFGGGAGCFFHGHRIVIGSNVPYDATNTIISIPTAPVTAISGTASLLLGTGAGIVDASGKHTIETVGNTHKSTAQARFTSTGADYYDGNSDYLTIKDNPLLELGSGNFTIEAWVYPLNNSSRSIFGHGPDGQNWWAFYLDGTGKLEFAIVSGNSVVVDRISSTTVNTNTWTHVAVTRSGSTFRLFIDGQEPASYTGSPATTSSATPDFSTDFWIGGQRWSGSGNGFQGYIQDLRVTRGVARYTSNFTPLTRTLELG